MIEINVKINNILSFKHISWIWIFDKENKLNSLNLSENNINSIVNKALAEVDNDDDDDDEAEI